AVAAGCRGRPPFFGWEKVAGWAVAELLGEAPYWRFWPPLTAPVEGHLLVAGGSGAGKTTVLQLLLRFYDAQQGSIRIDGVDVQQADFTALRQRIGLVPQDAVIFSASAADNIRYGRPDASDAEVRAAAHAAQAEDFIVDLPQGDATYLGERGVRLSGGQRQRIAIARALILEPQILILDEPTSALDVSVQQQVLERLAALQQRHGLAYVLISHDLAVIAALAHHVLVLHRGRVVEQGPVDAVLRAPQQPYTQALLAAADLDGNWHGR
ncbi:MAG: ATP-binding cassette domain-containing protein, partial [Thiomonas sp.]